MRLIPNKKINLPRLPLGCPASVGPARHAGQYKFIDPSFNRIQLSGDLWREKTDQDEDFIDGRHSVHLNEPHLG